MTRLGDIGRRMKTGRSREAAATDLDAAAFEAWWDGGAPANFADLRTVCPGLSNADFALVISRARQLYDLVLAFPSTQGGVWSGTQDIRLALEQKRPGLSDRAYQCAADRVTQCFMSFESWM